MTNRVSELDITQARRDAIRALIRNQRIETQEHLRELLSERGFEVTQATLSRDLARLEARRVSLTEGGATYELPGSPALKPQADLSALRDMIFAIIDTDSMVVIQTRAGAASAVALGMDESRFPEIAGTLAGDDTIFVAPSKGTTPSRLKRFLDTVYGITPRTSSASSKKTSSQKLK